MATKTPIKATFSGSVAVGLAEFESGDTLPTAVVPQLPIPINTAQTGAYTFVLADANCCTPFNSSTAADFTIPTNASVAFPIGTALYARQAGTAAATFVGASGVTVNNANSAAMAGAGDWLAAVKVGTNEWDVL
jgi:hypothetical protein